MELSGNAICGTRDTNATGMTATEAIPEELADELTTPIGFIETYLGLSLYPWQDKVLAPLELATGKNAKRVNIAAITPNGAGKDTVLICGAAHYWLGVHPAGKVVITSKSDLQITQQTIPAIEHHRKNKFVSYQAVHSPRYELTTPTGGKCICFVTNKGERAEGWHKADDFTGPLLLIINEGKSVDQTIFDSLLGRCTPNAVMVVSSPGPKTGPLWDIATKNREKWHVVQVGLADCPHTPQERIDYVISTYGENHPVTRSTLYGEFMDQENAEEFVVNATALEALLVNPPRFKPGITCGFCDFGGAQSEHVFVLRNGNKYEIRDAWLESNSEAAANRFIRNFRESGLKQEQIWGDASDAKIAAILSDSGWRINRKNFGDKAGAEEIYTSWGAEAWWEMGLAIDKGEVILPDDPKLRAQLTTRKKTIGARGKLGVEEKYVMAKPPRNLPSPDRADAICGALNIRDYSMLHQKEPYRIPPGYISDWQGCGEQSEEFAEAMGANTGL